MNAILNGRYEVLTAATESDARNLLAAHVGEIEIILMDISLNGTEDGLRLTKSLREEGCLDRRADHCHNGTRPARGREQGPGGRLQRLSRQAVPSAGGVGENRGLAIPPSVRFHPDHGANGEGLGAASFVTRCAGRAERFPLALSPKFPRVEIPRSAFISRLSTISLARGVPPARCPYRAA